MSAAYRPDYGEVPESSALLPEDALRESQAAEFRNAPYRTPVDFAAKWVSHADSFNSHRKIATQIQHGFGLLGAAGELASEEAALVHEYEEVLSWLRGCDDPVRRLRAQRLGAHLVRSVWKDAYHENNAYDRAREAAELFRQTITDPLTGLLNRRGLGITLDDAIRLYGEGVYEGVGLLYLDLDRFKQVNDTLGHKAGDQLLEGVATIIMQHTRRPLPRRPGDVVARLPHGVPLTLPDKDDPALKNADTARTGGDEFVLVVPLTAGRQPHPSRGDLLNQTHHERLLVMGARLQKEITDYMVRMTDGRIPGIGVSIGVALCRDGMSAEGLIYVGDRMMYSIKHGIQVDAAALDELYAQAMLIKG